jgi:uroporphyrinogen decarboxylase
VLSIEHTEIESLQDPRIETAALFHPGMLATYGRLRAEAADAAVAVGLTGTFSQLAFLFGLEKLLLALIDDPTGVRKALRRRQKVVCSQIAELCDAGARLIWIGEGVASGTVLSPRMYEEFVLPYEQEVTAEIRRRGARSLLHICGNTTPMLPQLARSAADGCDVDHLTDWPAAVHALGAHVAIKGNLNPLLFMPGEQTALKEACQRTISQAEKTPGFILSTGCLVPRDADPAAFEVCASECRRTHH